MTHPAMVGRQRVRKPSWDLLWDEVWDEYDTRHGRPAGIPAQLHRKAQRQSLRRRGRSLPALLTAFAILLLGVSAYAAAPIHAVRGIIDAFRTSDHAALAELVDWTALRASQATSTSWSLSPLSSAPAEAFLAGLADTVQQRVATPEGLLALVHARVGPGGLPPRLETTGIGTARLTLAATDSPGRGISLSLTLRDTLPPRWVVVAAEPLG